MGVEPENLDIRFPVLTVDGLSARYFLQDAQVETIGLDVPATEAVDVPPGERPRSRLRSWIPCLDQLQSDLERRDEQISQLSSDSSNEAFNEGMPCPKSI